MKNKILLVLGIIAAANCLKLVFSVLYLSHSIVENDFRSS